MLNNFAAGPFVLDFTNSAFDEKPSGGLTPSRFVASITVFRSMPCTLSRASRFSSAMDRHDHGIGIRDATALSPDPRHLVARPLPEISERATDIASAYHCDLHRTPSSLQSLP